ncbi:MAG: acyl-CoA thioesterase [Rikenellaceae bacterium]|jgi:acyl-CoA thioester hydrolase|nr:acyl-CoA thioesterase [Rikenellaceae bacterium]
MRFDDTDMLGHINNVNLQHYFDLGKTEYFQKALGQPVGRGEQGLIQKAIHTTYEAQTRLGEPIAVTTVIERIGNKSITFHQEVINTATREVKAISTSTLVAFDYRLQQTIPVPADWRRMIVATEGPEVERG